MLKLRNKYDGRIGTVRFMQAIMTLIIIVFVAVLSSNAFAMQKISDEQLTKHEGGSAYYSGTCSPYTNSCPGAVLTCTPESGIPHGQETVQGYRRDVSSTESPSTCSGDIVYHGEATCGENANWFYSYTTRYYYDENCAFTFGTPEGLCRRNQCEDVIVLLP